MFFSVKIQILNIRLAYNVDEKEMFLSKWTSTLAIRII